MSSEYRDNRKEEATRSRLESIRELDFKPWHKSFEMTDCHLYWMPVANTPMLFRQRQWCLRFARLLQEKIAPLTGAQPNLFLQMKVVQPNLADPFIRNATRFVPLLGLSRRRGASLPALPDEKYIEQLQQGKIKYDHQALQPDYCYWFLYPETEEQMRLFFGHGGMMMLFVSTPEGEKPPLPFIPPGVAKHPQFAALLAENRLEKMTDSITRMKSPFFPQTKTIFGRGLEDDLQFPGLKFVVPLLSIEDFLEAKPEEIEEWFTVFDVVLTESPKDKGLIIASRHEIDLDETLSEIVESMKEDGEVYPEAR